MFCVYCSKEMAPGSVLCGSCGNNLKERLLKCRNCGYQALEGDRFCLRCSTEIEFMHVPKPEEVKMETRHASYAFDAPKPEEVKMETRHTSYMFDAPKPEDVKMETRHTSYTMYATKPEEINPIAATPRPVSSPHDDIPPVNLASLQSDPHIGRKRDSNRWGRFVAAWIIFIAIACGGAFAAFWYFDEILSFFQIGSDSPIIAENLETGPYQVILPQKVIVEELPEEAEPGQVADLQIPLPIVSTSTIAAGPEHYLAISETGHLWSWGTNASGQLGIGSTDEHLQPVLVMNDAVSVHAALDRTVAITADGTLWSFGNNDRGQLGDGSTTSRYLPVQILENVVFVSITDDVTFAITNDDLLWAWGANDEEQLGDGTTIDRHSPTFIRDNALEFAAELGLIEDYEVWIEKNLTIGGEQIVYISSNPHVSLVLTESGYVWGFVGCAIEAVEQWNEDEFFVVMANVRLPTRQLP